MPEISSDSAEKFLTVASELKIIGGPRTIGTIAQPGDPIKTSLEEMDLVLETPNRWFGRSLLAYILRSKESRFDLIFVALRSSQGKYYERLRSIVGVLEEIYVPANPIPLSISSLMVDNDVKRAFVGSFHLSYDSQETNRDRLGSLLVWRYRLDLYPDLNRVIPELQEHIIETIKRDHPGFR